MMRVLTFGLLLLLGACSGLDTSSGASGFPDMPVGTPGFQRGSQSVGGTTTLNRELPPGDPRRFAW